jgi:NADPH:quinone reductase-like Zn-dependent oxidoreductase
MSMASHMKAAVVRRYGPPHVVKIEHIPRPVPGPNDVLIRVHASTVSTADWRIRSLSMPYGFGFAGRLAFGITAPRQVVLGSELSGDVVAVGASVHTFAVGDAVVAYPGVKLGAHAEYCCMNANAAIVHKPSALSYASVAALAFGGTTALDYFRRGALQAGEHVLINGASGTVGSAMVQIAVAAGARVTAVCSGANIELMQQLGATRAVDYTRADFAAEGIRYDVIADTVGNAPYSRVREALAPRGRLLLVLATLPEMLRAPWINRTSPHRIVAGPAAERVDDLQTLVAMAADGRFTPLIDSRFSLEEIAAAHARVETKRKRGSVLVC